MTRPYRWAPWALAVVGLSQMAGDVLGWPALRGLAAATGAAPAPKVFGSVAGHETFSARFTLQWDDGAGRRSLDVTPEVYERLRGPYNRRNAYGAALSYGPVLQADPAVRPMFEDVARHAVCGDAAALHELAGDVGPVRRARVVYAPAAHRGVQAGTMTLEVACP